MNNKITKNSHIRVVWKDRYENFSQDKKKQVKSYYQKLYGTPHIKVETLATNKPGLVLSTIGTEEIENVQEPTVQLKLLLKHLTENNIDVKHSSIEKLNVKVDGLLEASEASEFNKWEIDKITIDNFLSYGNLTILNYKDIPGLTLVPSENQQGKTTAFCESILFVLFGITTKTESLEEIFNIYTDKDYVLAEVYVKFDNKPFVIERKLTRKLQNDGVSYKITTKLSFKEILPNGEFKSLSGEQKDTNKDIKKIIGSAEDFLMTVLCTGDNLNDLIGSLPTKRGEILTKFLGLEVFSKKEKIAKELEKEWKSTSSLVKYDLGSLRQEIEDKELIIQNNDKIIIDKKLLEDSYTAQINTLADNKNNLFLNVKNDVDEEILKYNIDTLNIDLSTYNEAKEKKDTELLEIINKLNNYGDIDFDKDNYELLIKSKSDIDMNMQLLGAEIKSLTETIVNLKDGESCSKCGQSLKDVDHGDAIKKSEEKVALKLEEGRKLRSKLDILKPQVEDLKLKSDNLLSKEKDELIKDKIEIDIENLSLKIENEKNKIKTYNDNLDKIEKNKEIRGKIREVEIEIEQVEIRKKDLVREIQALENENKMSEVRKNEIDNIIITIQKDEIVAKLFSVYIEAMGKNGISKTILKTIIPQINYELEKMMEDVCDFTANIEINTDNNEVAFWMYNNDNPIRKKLKTASGYEKTVAALALRVVLSRINTLPKLNILILDEILGKVSHGNLENVKLFLDKVKRHFDSVILITHNTLIREWGDNIIEVVKENNCSKLLMK